MTNRRSWLVLSLLAVGLFSWVAGSRIGYQQIERQSLEESFRYSQLVANKLDRYGPIAELIAQHPLLIETVNNSDDPELITATNEELARIARVTGSSVVYLMNTRGITIATSNHQLQTSFIGRDFAFRPYFSEAMATGGDALYFALGITTNERGLYFSHVITAPDNPDRTLGVVTIKALVNDLESQWRRPETSTDSEMVVLDSDGISFLASDPSLLFRAFEPIDDARLEAIQSQRRYFDEPLLPMEVEYHNIPPGFSNQTRRLTIVQDGKPERYISVDTALPRLDWTLRVLNETSHILWIQIQFLLTGVSLYVAFFLTWLYIRERLRREQELAQRGHFLEHRVAERTADLEASNQQLKSEIRDRERFEKELKETQQELIQAAKLAVLGQMSAGLNHEINQPLTAIQAYARNSQRFVERGDLETTKANLDEIVTLCHKMADLTRQFKVFARKSEGPPTSVDLRLAIDAALKIITAQEHSERVDIQWHRPDSPVYVHGDLIRIEQVLVNLITNALHAVEDTRDPAVRIRIDQEPTQVICCVSDNGPGLPANTEQLFEPFFTTKSRKQGLGLGLSISRQIVDAIGGQLTCRNSTTTHGAEFALVLIRREGSE